MFDVGRSIVSLTVKCSLDVIPYDLKLKVLGESLKTTQELNLRIWYSLFFLQQIIFVPPKINPLGPLTNDSAILLDQQPNYACNIVTNYNMIFGSLVATPMITINLQFTKVHSADLFIFFLLRYLAA